MATTASILPIVGYDQIVSIYNSDGPTEVLPLVADQTTGRKGKMRIAFRLVQSDTQNGADTTIALIVKRPLAVLGDGSDQAPYTPSVHICHSGIGNPADTHPRIVPSEADASNIEDGTLSLNLYFTESADPGFATYDVDIDFSHSIAN